MSEAPFIKRPKRGIFKRSTRDTGLIEDIAIVSQLGFIILFGIFGGGWTVYRQIRELYKTSTKKRKDK